jgi:type III restriction enzyme
VQCDGADKLYFVVETKGSLFSDVLRPAEKAKIACGKEHFKAIGEDIGFTVANKFDEFMGSVL